MDEHGEAATRGVSRRDALKKAAVAGAVVAWATPAVQLVGAGGAHAQAGSACAGCLSATLGRGLGQSGQVSASAFGFGGCAVGCAAGAVSYSWNIDAQFGLFVPGAVLNTDTFQCPRLNLVDPTTATLTVTVSMTCGGAPISCQITGDYVWPPGNSGIVFPTNVDSSCPGGDPDLCPG